MRTIDGDALEELFREVIGGIAKKPEMNGNLEHMVRASAMVIEMILDAPTIEPERKTGKWIPCSERLPEVGEEPYYIDPIDGNKLFESQRVLVYGTNEAGYDIAVTSLIYCTASGYEWLNAYDAAENELTQIIAWMPLPEPYREEQE